MVGRRDLLGMLGAGALVAGLPARAQSARPRIGWISWTRAADGTRFLDALRRGLQERGQVEGTNYTIDAYWGDDSPSRGDELAAKLVASKPDLIVALGPVNLALRRLDTSIPVVFGFSGDPVEAGLVESLSRPGRNFTGISFLTVELAAKRVELLKESLPGAKRLAVVASPRHAGDQTERRASLAAATAAGLSMEWFDARNADELEKALAAIEKSQSQAVMLFPVALVISQRERIAAWSLKNRLPTISGWGQFAEGGNLMSYGPNLADVFRRLAVYVERIVRGARPAELPVELPTRFELVINVKTAKALGIRLPQSVLARADALIQ